MRVSPPPVPVIVIVYVPGGVDGDVEIMSVEVKVGVAEDGPNETVTPEGWPDADKLTELLRPLLKPLRDATEEIVKFIMSRISSSGVRPQAKERHCLLP